MWEFETELAQVIKRTPTIRTFRFPIRAKNVRFRPGQFFFITILVKGGEAQHHFSFSNSPTEKGYIEFTKRITESDFSRTLAAIEPGAWAALRGPLGDFTLPRQNKKLGFLSGGIGITPMRGMLRYIMDKGLNFDVVLLYGNLSWEEIAFREELEAWAASNPRIRVEHVLWGTSIPPGWSGKTGFINSELVKELVPDYMERLFYISGPPRMVVSLQEQLGNTGVPASQVRHDSFTGYDWP